ncbi:CaiB/BaiF CoA-transferase family protein [Hydrogenophaga sp. BPS33]|uniref:CaiB/BaiF CoA-transferase family protein n=1 Tax=Hydrogenophaga sp. BPS33 TaxID=2651974 RepID=UPI00131F7652|nr:CoA transferase [Hydrogenophaga sp. BPS33]QHE84773.1 CoA transferase [Hydrogenophaga sp. BPS33]
MRDITVNHDAAAQAASTEVHTSKRSGPLTGMVIVEVGGGYASAYCAKLLSDFGAAVYKLEPIGGAPERLREPLLDTGQGVGANPFQAWLDAGKHSLCIDPANEADVRQWEALATRADAVVDSRAIESHGLHALQLPAHAAPVHLRFTWFGADGPRADHPGADFVSRAVAGHVKMTGAAEGPPVVVDAPHGQLIAGTTAFSGLLAALWAATPPRTIDLSVAESTVVLAEYLVAQCVGEGMPERRYGINRFAPNFPLGIYACKEGHVGVSVVTPAQWQSLCGLLGRPDLGIDQGLRLNMDRMWQADRLDDIFRPLFLNHTAQEWFAQARACRLPIAIVPDMETLLEQDVHRERGSFGLVHAGQKSFVAPVAPLTLTETPANSEGRTPEAGSCKSVPQGPAKKAPVQTLMPGDALPLSGLRILDLTMGWAGPLATRQLADLGADVVKIESCRYPDWWRGVDFTDASIEALAHEKTVRYNMQNRNKRVINLDLTDARGIDIFKRLLRDADAVVDNYSSGVMRKMGLDYDSLKAVNPGVIAMSMPAFGSHSMWSDLRAYGSTFEHASGMPTIVAAPGEIPTMSHQAVGDPIGGLNAAAALLTALHARRRSGRGQFIDLAQVQCLLPLLAPWIVHQSAFGHWSPGERVSAQSAYFSQCVRCAGDEQWLAVSVETEAQWQALCQWLAPDDRVDVTATAQAQGALAGRLAAMALDDAAKALQTLGVPAEPAWFPSELVNDAHLRARGFWQVCERAHIGPHVQASLPLRLDGHYPPVRRPAPLFGQHNEEILLGELGATRDELCAWLDAGVVGDQPLPSRAVVAATATRERTTTSTN